MDIKLFKPTYHELFTILTNSYKLIDKSFKVGAPEGPIILQEVYELQMDLRLTTISNPSKEKIQQVLANILDYLEHLVQTKSTTKITNLKDRIHQYLTTI